MANKQMRWSSASLIITEMQIKSHNEYHLTLVRMAAIKMSTNNKCWRGCWEKGTLLHCWWECKLVQPLWRTVWRFLNKLEIGLPYKPAIPLLGIHTKETRIERDTCTPVFITALFTIARTWKQPRCPWAQWNIQFSSVHLLSHVWFLATLRTAAYQVPLSMGFSRQEYWGGCHCLLVELPYEPAIPLLGIHTEETIIEIDTCTSVFITALFITART